MRIQDAKRSIKRPAEEPAYPERKRAAPAVAPASAVRTSSSHYDDRRYPASSRDSVRSAASSSGRDYGRGEDRRVSERSERYEAAPRRDEYRREYREPGRSSRDVYDSKGGGSGRQYTDRSGGTWHSGGSSRPLGNGQAAPQRDHQAWGAAMDRKTDSSQQWGRGGASSESSSRWGSSGVMRQPAVSSLPAGGLSGFLSPAALGVGGLMSPGVFGSVPPERFDAYKMHSSLPRRY
ncbi:bcl-2-associated transcription factor 1-like [Pollicipes pollicipes]|uniref:bcl-2-associated transcription factor 1-like n=1 Tax=Pollicipes pollicipes TaxID=41117 RepID=UPI0018857E5F|nr:bcl-2-associated transcription factor 1-like [Pollicipes pollicipes]